MSTPNRRSGIRRAGRITLGVAAALLFGLPVLWIVVSALRPPREIFEFLAPLTPRVLIPETLTLRSFSVLLSGTFPRALVNSLVVAVLTVAGGLLLCSTAAFGLSAVRFRHREAVFAVVVISFMIPFEAIAIPLSQLFRDWGLQNSYAGLVLPGVANGLAIFLLRQFFLGIPSELKDAARVDGAGLWTIFTRIYLPLSKPPLIGAGLILFMFSWREYLWPLLIISEPGMDVAPVALAKFVGQFQFDYGQLFAGALLVAAIPAVLLLRLQRYFRQSVASVAIKE